VVLWAWVYRKNSMCPFHALYEYEYDCWMHIKIFSSSSQTFVLISSSLSYIVYLSNVSIPLKQHVKCESRRMELISFPLFCYFYRLFYCISSLSPSCRQLVQYDLFYTSPCLSLSLSFPLCDRLRLCIHH